MFRSIRLAAAAGAAGAVCSAAPLLVYFPPVAPPLGAPRPAVAPPSPWPAPPQLAAYIGDPFYAPLSTRLASHEVGDDLAYRLRIYTATKTALLRELRAHLGLVRDLDPATRDQAVRAFAADQTPRIAAWERMGEELRRDLCSSGSGEAVAQAWLAAIQGYAPPPQLRAAFTRDLLRFALYYQDGLSLEQRQLLREMALQYDREANPRPPGPYSQAWYFSPAPARLLTPADLPPQLNRTIARYQSEKDALKAELLDALRQHLGRAGPDAWRALAAQEAPRFADLHALADAIRAGLARLSDPIRPPEVPAVPAALARRIERYHTIKLSIQRGLLACAEAARRADPVPGEDTATRIRRAIDAYQRANQARCDALVRSGDEIRAALAALTQSAPGASADSLVAGFDQAVKRLVNYWDYRDYQMAALLPGLSPEQRRLLFEGAMEKLALPLPGAEKPVGFP